MNIKPIHSPSRCIFVLVAAIMLLGSPGFAVDKGARVKLVLQITIDQLRGDQPLLFKDRFGEGGFKLLFNRGAYYANAHYSHADTETAPGHATLATGTVPARHGITNSE